MIDKLLLATVAGGSARVIVATTTNLVDEARRRHDTFPTASAALGRTMTAGLLLATSLKGEDIITIRVLGDGPLGGIIVTADASGSVRGYVQEPHTNLPPTEGGKLNVGGAVGKGTLCISRDMGFGEPYTGSVELVSGEIADDVTYYLTVSEQTPSAVGLGVLVNTDYTVLAAGGYLIQMMPGASEETIATLEANQSKLAPVSTLVAEGKDAHVILELLTRGLPMIVHEERKIEFDCRCSKQRLEKILISLGSEELKSIITEEGKVDLTCHFCGDEFQFNRAELEELVQSFEKQEL